MTEICCFRRSGAKRRIGCPFTLDLIGETSRSRMVTFALILVTCLFAFQSLFFGNLFETRALPESRGTGSITDVPSSVAMSMTSAATTTSMTVPPTSLSMANDDVLSLLLVLDWAIEVGTIILFIFCVSVSNSKTQHPLVSISGILSMILLVRYHRCLICLKFIILHAAILLTHVLFLEGVCSREPVGDTVETQRIGECCIR